MRLFRLKTAARFLMLLTVSNIVHAADFRDKILLDGEWRFQLDPDDVGRNEHWYVRLNRFAKTIAVPGVWQAQGSGLPNGSLRSNYEGIAWYAREIAVPGNWADKRIDVIIGGAFTYTDIYVNGLPVGSHAGFDTPFRFDVTPFVKIGETNTIVMRISSVRNPLQPQRKDLSIRDTSDITGAVNFAAKWGGIYRSVELEAHEAAHVDRVVITPASAQSSAKFSVFLKNGPLVLADAQIGIRIENKEGHQVGQKTASIDLSAAGGAVDLDVQTPKVHPWSPDHPNLYKATISLKDRNGRVLDERLETFGFRDIQADGTRLLLNGKPIYLRGYGDDSVEPLTGAPPYSKEVYLRRMRIAKNLGFNAVRYHSTIPVQECFEAADEVGLLVLAELPVAYQEYLLPHKDVLRSELTRIIDSYRNHPSWFFLTLGNEFGLHRFPDKKSTDVFLAAVNDLTQVAKARYPQLMVSSNSGYLVPPMDIAVPYQGFAPNLPNIKHEYGGYYGTLPDLSLIPKFTGVFEPDWLIQQKVWVDNQNEAVDYQQYLESSWRFYASIAKTYIEKLRALSEFTGYFYWLINDYPAGTPEGAEWNWGWLNIFWEPKGITPELGREMNAAILSLIDCPLDSRSFWLEDGKAIGLSISNYGDAPIKNGRINWSLSKSGRQITTGQLNIQSAPLGEVTRIGEIALRNLPITDASEFDLIVSIQSGSQQYINRWKLWGFPKQSLLRQAKVPVISQIKSATLKRLFPFVQDATLERGESGVMIASDFNPKVMAFLQSGGRVLMLATPQRFGSMTSFFPAMGGALGLKIRKEHPALDGFPLREFPDLQFYNFLEGATQFQLKGAQPIVSGLRMTRNAKKASFSQVTFLSEGTIGKGAILFCGLNIASHLDESYPESIYMLDRLLRYLISAEFQPSSEISEEQLDAIRVPYTSMIH